MKYFIAVIFSFLCAFSPVGYTANAALCDELTQDPLGRGYAGMTPEVTTEDINTAYRQVFRDSIAGAELFEGIESADWTAISETDRVLAVSLLSFPGSLNPQGNVRTLLISIFGGGSATISNMADIARHNITRAAELGLGRVRAGDVVTACQ